MANGTLKVQNIQTSSGSGTITLGQSGETIALGSGVTSKMNHPAFEATLTASQSISDNVLTKVEFDNEIFDTDNCYDNTTNYRFTPNVAGKYLITATCRGDSQGDSQIQFHNTHIYKNGSSIARQSQNFQANYPRVMNLPISYIVELNGTTDYIEVYYLLNDTSGTPIITGTTSYGETYFSAYRIGVE